MLANILKAVSRETVLDGVFLYRYSQDKGMAPGSYLLDRSRSDGAWVELFFCCSGALTLQRKSGAMLKLSREESILLYDDADLISVSVQEPPTGYCLSINLEACSAFRSLYQTLDYTAWNRDLIQDFLHKRGGYLQIQHGCWNQSIFSILHGLPEPDQGSYCVLKAAELFYLINSHQALSSCGICQPTMPAYLMQLMRNIGAYIEAHLDEKLTISLLCLQFNLSPTTLKNKFREFYGQPIHSWILYCRARRAAELLRSTDMTILQIAQSVGYEGVSQFNVVFQRVYGIVPSRYRKISDSGKI